MPNSAEQIANNLELTKQELTEKIVKIEEQVRDSIQETKDKFTDKVQTLKDATDVRKAITKNPWIAASGATLAGFAASYYFMGKKSQASRPMGIGKAIVGTTLLNKAVSLFEPELTAVKGLAVQSVAKKLGDMAVKKFPKLEGEIQQIVESAKSKLGVGTAENSNQNGTTAPNNLKDASADKAAADTRMYTALPE